MRAEPAVVGAAVAAVINLFVLLVFNEHLDKDQETAIVTVVTLVAGLFIRSKVTPVA